MISLHFQKLKRYRELVLKIAESKKENLHLAITTKRYFDFAELQVRDYEKDVRTYFEAPEHNQDLLELCYSKAFGFYTLIRTSLEASRRLSIEILSQEHDAVLQKFREENSGSIVRIIGIANNIVKHPLEDAERKKMYFYEPGGLDLSGTMDIYEWSADDDRRMKVLEINPIEDCDTIYEYLEGFADIRMKQIKNLY